MICRACLSLLTLAADGCQPELHYWYLVIYRLLFGLFDIVDDQAETLGYEYIP